MTICEKKKPIAQYGGSGILSYTIQIQKQAKVYNDQKFKIISDEKLPYFSFNISM
jgi:hypothetical protein